MDQLLLVSGRVTLCYLASANVGNGLGFGFCWLVSGMVTGVVFGGGGGWLMMLQLFAWLNDDSDDDVNVAMGGGCWSLPPPLLSPSLALPVCGC